jgi:Ca2+/Na+ antiporter
MAYNRKSTQSAKFDRKDKFLVLLIIILLLVTFPLVRSFYIFLIPLLIFLGGGYLLMRVWRSASHNSENGESTSSSDWWSDFVIHLKDTLRVVFYMEIALLLIFAGSVFAFQYYAKEKDSQRQLTQMSLSLAKYKHAHGRYPDNLLEIIGNDPLKRDWLRDAWGNPVEYRVLEGGRSFVLRSAGSDGTLDTSDDLESRY